MIGIRSSPSSSTSPNISPLFSKEAINRELQYLLHNQQQAQKQVPRNESKIKGGAPQKRENEDELTQYNHQQILIQYRKYIIKQTIQKYQNDLFQQDIFQTISHYLMENPSLSYERFLILKEISPENIKKYFTAQIFLYLSPETSFTAIESIDFIKYMDQSMKIEQQMLKLLTYSSLNEEISMISTEQLQEYLIVEYIPLIDPMNEMDETFYEFYCCQVIQKFSYYLDLQNTNRISVRKIVHSSIMREMAQLIRYQQLLQEKEAAAAAATQAEENKMGALLSFQKTQQQNREVNELIDKINENWFSVNKSINLYTIFLNLDTDHNGLLNIGEISSFQGFHKDPVQFTKIALKRIFEELILFSPFELDYRGFIRLVLLLDDLQAIPENHQLIVDQHFHVVPHYHQNASNSIGGDGVALRGKDQASPTKITPSSSNNPFYHLSNGFNALKFFWKILTNSIPQHFTDSHSITSEEDLGHRSRGGSEGRLTPLKVKYFYDDLSEAMKSQYSMELPQFPVFLFEFYDLMNYSTVTCDIDLMNSENIGPCFDDLLASNQCKLLLLLLLDTQTYWKYENREYLIANQVNDPSQSFSQPIIPQSTAPASSSQSSSSSSHKDNHLRGSQEKATIYNAHMTNYHYYSDDSYEDDSFYSEEENEKSGSALSQENRKKIKKSSHEDEDDDEIDQFGAIDKSMNSKYQKYSSLQSSSSSSSSSSPRVGSNASNRSTIEEMKKNLSIKELLAQNHTNDADDYDF